MSLAVKLLTQLKTLKWVDLSHTINDQLPYFESFSAIKERELFTKEEHGFWSKEYTLVGQYSTHIDAPTHFSQSSLRTVDQLSLKELCAPLYVLRLEEKVEDNPDYSVGVQDILDFEKQYGRIEPEAFVAFCSNWSKRINDKTAYYNYDANKISHTPGWSLEALKFLVEQRNIIGIGHETLNTDSGLDLHNNQCLMAEQYILDQNRYQIEVMNNLEQLPPTGAIIISMVAKVENASGFPIRSMAILSE